MRMLTDRREALSRRRVQTVNRLQALLAELLPGQAKKDITPLQAKAMLARVRSRDIAGKTGRSIAAEELAELVAVDAKIKKATAELKVMVLARGSRLRIFAVSGRWWRPGSWPMSVTWPGSPTATGSHPGPAPHPWTPRRVSRTGTGTPERGPADQPHDPHCRGHPNPSRYRGSGLLPT